ncbi:MAG: flavin reductase family protein [Rhodospirillales bacterium]|nr:flavin reductase family protein [Rhodospirillales bacterium]
MKALPLAKVYQLLEPGPVVLLTTAHKGCANVMTMSWLTPMEFEPPLIACIVSEANHSFAALRATKECVIAIPARDLARQMVAVGNCSGRTIDKFKKFGLTPLQAKRVKPPLIAECFANIECKVVDTGFVKKYNLFVLEAVKAWIDPKRKNPKILHHRGDGVFAVDGKIVKLQSKMP